MARISPTKLRATLRANFSTPKAALAVLGCDETGGPLPMIEHMPPALVEGGGDNGEELRALRDAYEMLENFKRHLRDRGMSAEDCEHALDLAFGFKRGEDEVEEAQLGMPHNAMHVGKDSRLAQDRADRFAKRFPDQPRAGAVLRDGDEERPALMSTAARANFLARFPMAERLER